MTDAHWRTPLVLGEAPPAHLRARYAHWLGEPVPRPSSGLFLRLDGDGLTLTDGEGDGLRIDYTRGPVGWRLGRATLKNEALARACGLKRGHRPAILDATAGLGRDGLVLARLGSRVTLVERSPALHALVADALRRADDTPALGDALRRIELIGADARAVLDDSARPTPDVVYLDPMFERPTRRGAVGREMALLQQLHAGDEAGAGDDLLAPARTAARERVVVKRHRRAPALAATPPDFSLTGRSTRFDVYLAASAPAASDD